jgi:hypothetical protein
MVCLGTGLNVSTFIKKILTEIRTLLEELELKTLNESSFCGGALGLCADSYGPYIGRVVLPSLFHAPCATLREKLLYKICIFAVL